MAFQQVMAASLAVVLAIGASPVILAQQQGTIIGQATDEADDPYGDFTVQLRDPSTNQIIATQVLNGEGEFSFTGLGLSQYLIELIDTSDDNEVVCAEGPFEVSADTPSLRVVIDCGGPPAALWLIAGAAGLAAVAGATTAGETPEEDSFSATN